MVYINGITWSMIYLFIYTLTSSGVMNEPYFTSLPYKYSYVLSTRYDTDLSTSAFPSLPEEMTDSILFRLRTPMMNFRMIFLLSPELNTSDTARTNRLSFSSVGVSADNPTKTPFSLPLRLFFGFPP